MKIKIKEFDPIIKRAALIMFGGSAFVTLGRLSLNTFLCDQYIQKLWIRYRWVLIDLKLILFLNKFHHFTIRYGLPVKKLNSKLLSLTTDVLVDLNLSSKLHKFDFFPCRGHETMYLGLYSLNKASIGLPFYFDYITEEHVEKNDLAFFDGQMPNWKQENGKLFLKTLVLSEDAKKYAIAENVYLAKSKEQWIRCFNTLASSMFGIVSIIRMEMILKESVKYSRIRRCFYSIIVGILMYMGWSLAFKKFADLYTNKVIDRFLTEIDNQNYIDGGLEFYSKLQQRNQLFSSFLGDVGKKYIKPNGDVKKLFSDRYSITQMIENLSKYDQFAQTQKKFTEKLRNNLEEMKQTSG